MSYCENASNEPITDIQLCPKCCCASVAVLTPALNSTIAPSQENESFSNTLDSVISQLVKTSDSTSSNNIPTVTSCRCGTTRRGSSVGSQALEENEADRKMLLERLCLLNQHAMVTFF